MGIVNHGPLPNLAGSFHDSLVKNGENEPVGYQNRLSIISSLFPHRQDRPALASVLQQPHAAWHHPLPLGNHSRRQVDGIPALILM